MELVMDLEAAGCPTVCMHCWAQGVSYRAMPLEEIEWVLEQSRRFCTEAGLGFGSFPFHEVAAHPQAPQVMQFYRDFFGDDPGFEPLATTGAPIAMREDWEPFLTAIGVTGTKTFWVAFHGYGAAHDRLVHREGAFEETCLAVRRIRSLGFRCGANVFVTREMAGSFEMTADTLQAVGLDEMSWEPARYHPTARSRQYEAHRPGSEDLLPIADRVLRLTGFWKEQWRELETYTEANWVQKATAGEWPTPWKRSEYIGVVCRPNGDVHTGQAGLYRKRHGNLKRDGVEATLQSAIRHGACSEDQLHFQTDAIPPIEELARQVGDPEGRSIFFDAPSMRTLWIDRMAKR